MLITEELTVSIVLNMLGLAQPQSHHEAEDSPCHRSGSSERYPGSRGRTLIHVLLPPQPKVMTSKGSASRILLVFFVVQSLSHVQLFVTPWTAARQAYLSFTVSWSLLNFMSIELVMLSNRLIFCLPVLLLPSIFPSIRLFSIESALHIRWPKYCKSATASILPMSIQH